ncbi:response regulator [Paenibacillus azoreducens]|uniref:response regulator n=1 Tax=Paenibacillus azoreducens TaxID=116718 RepID=UPI0039F45A8A
MFNFKKQWHWYHWILFLMRILWLSHIMILAWRQPELFHSPIGLVVTLSVLVFIIPLLLHQLYPKGYLPAEIGLAGSFSIYLAGQNAEFSWQFIIFACMIAFFCRNKTSRWAALALVLMISAAIAWAANEPRYDIWFTYTLNHAIAFALGYGWQLFVLHQRQNEIIQEQSRVLEQHLAKVEQLTLIEERNRLSHELHDTIGHTLTSIIVGVESLRPSCPQELDARMETIANLARYGLEDIRKHLHHLSEPLPNILTESLQQLVEDFAQSTGVAVHFRIFGHEVKVSKRISLCLHRCLQESLTNAVRHGKANLIQIHLFFDEYELRMQIEDNGQGMEQIDHGFGLDGMKERLTELAGHLSIHSTPNIGTLVVCTIPLRKEPSNQEISILLVDDQPIITESLQRILEQQQGFAVVGTAAQGQEAIKQCELHRPDVVLMDVRMPVLDGLEALRQIKQNWPEIRVVMLTTFDDMQQASLSLQLGAEGYLLKSAHPHELCQALKAVYNGGTWIDQGMAAQVFKEIKQQQRQQQNLQGSKPQKEQGEYPYGLSKRELDILLHLTSGLRYKSIANKMFLSEGTVRNYCSNLYSKLGVRNREDAIAKARQERLCEIDGA